MAKAAPSVPIAREEWDFSALDDPKFPKERLQFCYTYEYARQVMREMPAFLKFFKKAGKRMFDKHGTWNYFLQGAPDQRGAVFSAVIDAPVGFPDKPYLQLVHHITRRSYFPFFPEPGIKPWWVLSQVWYRNGKFYKGDLQEDLNLPHEKVAMFWIDWSYSPNQIVKAFKYWIDSQPRKDFYDLRGKNTAKQLRYDLNALGARRLIKALGTAAAADNHTAAFSDDSKGLFKNKSGWSDAKDRAEEILAQWKQAIKDSEIK